MKKYVIERNIPKVHCMGPDELKGAAATSTEALAKLSPRVQWLHSYVTPDKTFCIYLAEDEGAVREHAELSGFPANVISEVTTTIDPSPLPPVDVRFTDPDEAQEASYLAASERMASLRLRSSTAMTQEP